MPEGEASACSRHSSSTTNSSLPAEESGSGETATAGVILEQDASVLVKAVLAAHPLDHFSRLLLPYWADQAMARAQFSRLAKQLHPDKCGHSGAAEAFAAATAAWRGLRSSESASQLIAAVRQGAAELRGWHHLAGEPLPQASAPRQDGAASDDAHHGASEHGEGGGAAPEAPGREASEEEDAGAAEQLQQQQQPLSAAELRGLPEKDLKQRINALLLAAESREESFQKQTAAGAAGAEDNEAPGAVPAAAKKRARKAMAKRRSNFVRPADPSKPTCHLHVANTGPAFGVSCSALEAALEALGFPGVRVTALNDKCPFLYLSFGSAGVAAAARAALDRRSATSKPFLGRVLQADFAEAVLPVAISTADDGGGIKDPGRGPTPQEILARLQRSLTPARLEDEAGNLPEIAAKVPPTQAPVRCPLCYGDPFAVFARGRPFRMHLKSSVHGVEEGPLMVRIIELAQMEADMAEAKRKEEGGADSEATGVKAARESGAASGDGGSDLTGGLAAARDGDLEGLRRAAGGGWDATRATDRHGSTALHFAAGAGHLEACRYLVEELSVDAAQACETGRRDRRNALHWASRNGHVGVCRWLVLCCGLDINSATSDNTNAFHWAVWQARFEVCRWLVDNGCDWRAVNDWGCTAVHWAALQGNLPMLKWLHDLGLDLSHTNHQGHSALHKAAYKGHSEVCQWLLSDVGIDPTGLDEGGYTPSTIAKLQNHFDLADLLSAAERRAGGPDDSTSGGGEGKEQYTMEGPLGVLTKKAAGV